LLFRLIETAVAFIKVAQCGISIRAIIDVGIGRLIEKRDSFEDIDFRLRVLFEILFDRSKREKGSSQPNVVGTKVSFTSLKRDRRDRAGLIEFAYEFIGAGEKIAS
jgi:hypothetical protein